MMLNCFSSEIRFHRKNSSTMATKFLFDIGICFIFSLFFAVVVKVICHNVHLVVRMRLPFWKQGPCWEHGNQKIFFQQISFFQMSPVVVMVSHAILFSQRRKLFEDWGSIAKCEFSHASCRLFSVWETLWFWLQYSCLERPKNQSVCDIG